MVTNTKKQERVKKIEVIGVGNDCPKCSKPMERRRHRDQPKNTWFYEKWDYCKECKHIQHYEEFKSDDWQENERRDNFLRDL